MFERRLRELRRIITELKLDACLVTSVPNILYLTGYSGFSVEEREAFLLITADAQFLLTDGRYTTAVREQVPHFSLVEIGSRYSFKKAFETLVEEHRIKKLGIEENNLWVYEYKTILPFVKETMHVPAGQLRIKKTAEEIAAIEHACRVGDVAVQTALQHIKPDISEKHLASIIEDGMRKQDAEPSFRTIIGFGAHAAVPHHMTGDMKLGKRGLILIDSGAKITDYCSDMTRTVFLGKATAEEKKIYETVHEAQQIAAETLTAQLALLKAGSIDRIPAADIDKSAREYIISKGYPTIPHSLGHGIGLEVHELPSLSPVSTHNLENGMIFSIEPGIYIPGEAGVRIEDLYVIENYTLRRLTQTQNTLIEL